MNINTFMKIAGAVAILFNIAAVPVSPAALRC